MKQKARENLSPIVDVGVEPIDWVKSSLMLLWVAYQLLAKVVSKLSYERTSFPFWDWHPTYKSKDLVVEEKESSTMIEAKPIQVSIPDQVDLIYLM